MATTTGPQVEFRTVSGVRIRFADSGAADPGSPTLLLTSPWPESIYAFAPIWETLAARARLFAIDLPGFGASETVDDLLSPRAMGGFLADLVAELDLGPVHLVAPDVGTSAALFAAAAHPERFAGVVVGTGGAAIPLDLGEPLKSWVLDPDLDKYRQIDPRAIVEAAMETIEGGIDERSRADYIECYAGDRFVRSMAYVRRYPEQLPELAELLPGIEIPVTIINGSHDPVVPISNAEFLAARLRHGRVEIVDGGHFIWEEEPARYAAIVLDTLTDTARPGTIDMRLEVVSIPVSDVDRAKAFYGSLGWRLDADFQIGDEVRVVQFTPTHSNCSVAFGQGFVKGEPGSVERLELVVSDIEAARADLIERGVEVSGLFHLGDAGFEPGPDPQRASYQTYASFEDPDGNGWLLQEVNERQPGRSWED